MGKAPKGKKGAPLYHSQLSPTCLEQSLTSYNQYFFKESMVMCKCQDKYYTVTLRSHMKKSG